MKKTLLTILTIIISLNLTACQTSNSEISISQSTESESSENINIPEPEISESKDGIDVNLTELSSTMVYAEVYNMLVWPQDYVGKIVKMNGTMSILEDATKDKIYFAIVIKDATACCAQGIEFILTDEYKYPEDYPKLGEEATVIGEFATYEEDGKRYCNLINATLE